MDNSIELLRRNPRSYTKIVSRLRFSYLIKKMRLANYLPPTYKDSNFYIDLISIIFPKNSKITGYFNIM